MGRDLEARRRFLAIGCTARDPLIVQKLEQARIGRIEKKIPWKGSFEPTLLHLALPIGLLLGTS
jgi:hypothetical protein